MTKTIKITIAIAQLHPYTNVVVFMEVNAGRALLSTVSNVGKSEQHFKQRTQQHMGMGEVKRNHGHENWEDVGGLCGSDAFAKHFGSHVSHAKTQMRQEPDGKFCDVMGRIMMDEKWFHIQMPKRRCFILK